LNLLTRLPVLVASGTAGQGQESQETQLLQMLAYQIDGKNDQSGSAASFLQRIAQQPVIAAEFAELGAFLESRRSLTGTPVPGLDDAPLFLHASYGIREVLTAVGWLTPERRSPFRAGVLPLPQRKIELLFVTLDKSEGCHDRIAYRDYAISTERFHWQTQYSAGPDTPAGRRYVESPGNGWQFQLFVRTRKGEPYRACGPVMLELAEGDRPMTITWVLRYPLPARLFREFSVLRDA
jgi:hypothetical protein